MKKCHIRIIACICLISIAMSTTVFAAMTRTEHERYGRIWCYSEHDGWFEYYGYIQTNVYELYNQQRANRGYIRYSGGPEGDTGRLWTAPSNGNTVSQDKNYQDTINPIAPKVQFNYNFEWVPGDIHDFNSIIPA